MKYQIDWSENKNNDWKIVSLKTDSGTVFTDVSVNRTNKKGEVFPGFDQVVVGASIEGEFWTSPTGKNYLFAPKPQQAKGGGMGAQASKLMDKKAASIEKFQDNKETSIKLSGAMRDAVQIVMTFYPSVAEYASHVEKENFIKEKIRHWRTWLLENHGDMTDVKDAF
jgi:hypothetical protein